MRLAAGCTSSWKWSEALKSRLNYVTSIPENNELRYFLLYSPNVAEGKFSELRCCVLYGARYRDSVASLSKT